MENFQIIVIGASSGGVEGLRELFRGLDPNLQAAVFVVLHIPPDGKSLLPQILSRYCPIPVEQARDAERIQPGHAYIAPPDQHLILKNGTMHLTYGPKVNYTRPAIDPLFESAAAHYGSRVIGVILSGNLSDGTKDLVRIIQAGGVAVVQDPEEALFPSMPSSALQ
jgi:two-component system, chemotaxis family, protein-glutamate methylesterase/glutaminase